MKRMFMCLIVSMPLCLVLAAGAVAEDRGVSTNDLLDMLEEPTELMKAAGAGDMDAVRALVEKGSDVNGKSAGLTQSTALIRAAEKGHTDVVRYLIEKGADINANDGGGTPLIHAADNGHTDTVSALLEKGAEVNIHGQPTALMKAAANGHADIVRALLEKGAKVNVNIGGTALMFAAREGHADIVRALLEHGADLNATDSVGYTALSLAETRGQAEVVRILKEAGGPRADRQNRAPDVGSAKETLSAEDLETLNQLQPPASEAEKKLYQEAKNKGEVPKFIATRKYVRLLKARFGNESPAGADLAKAPSAADPDIVFDYAVDFQEQLLLFNIFLYQGIDRSAGVK